MTVRELLKALEGAPLDEEINGLTYEEDQNGQYFSTDSWDLTSVKFDQDGVFFDASRLPALIR